MSDCDATCTTDCGRCKGSGWMRARMLVGPLLSWESQVGQYPMLGAPGVDYFAGVVEGHAEPVHCLLWRGADGRVHGILNRYPVDYPPFERAGNVNVWVEPDWQGKGIGRRLVREAVRRWGRIAWGQQRYTEAGLGLARAMGARLG